VVELAAGVPVEIFGACGPYIVAFTVGVTRSIAPAMPAGWARRRLFLVVGRRRGEGPVAARAL
jgi:hypothetical protein